MKRDEPTTIEFKDQRKMVRFYCEGVMSSGRSFFIKDHSCDEWKVCSAERLANLVHKFGSAEAVGLEYTSRSKSDSKSSKSPSGAKGDKVVEKKVSTDKGLVAAQGSDRDTGYWIDPELRGPEYDGWR